MKTTFRAFIAVKIPQEIHNSLAAFQESLKMKGIRCKWVQPQNMHLTMCFLGEVESNLETAISLSLRENIKEFKRFDLEVRGAGVFPSLKRPRVLWSGISGDLQRVTELKSLIEMSVEKFGFISETGGFKPHLTIGRFREEFDSNKLYRVLEKENDRVFGEFKVDKVVFFRSDLKPSGPSYSEISSVKLI